MKKTYISPATEITKAQVLQMFLTLSTTERAAVVTDGKVDLNSRGDNSWDIWGNDDYEN